MDVYASGEAKLIDSVWCSWPGYRRESSFGNCFVLVAAAAALSELNGNYSRLRMLPALRTDLGDKE